MVVEGDVGGYALLECPFNLFIHSLAQNGHRGDIRDNVLAKHLYPASFAACLLSCGYFSFGPFFVVIHPAFGLPPPVPAAFKRAQED